MEENEAAENFSTPGTDEASIDKTEEIDKLSKGGATGSTETSNATIKQILQNLVTAVQELRPQASDPKRIQKASDQISALWTIATKIIGFSILALVVWLMLSIIWTSFAAMWGENETIELSSFEITPELEKSGLSSRTIANELSDQINFITKRAQTNLTSPVFNLPPSEAEPDIEIPETRTSLRTLTRYINNLFGGKPTEINGELVRQGEELQLTIRIVGRKGTPNAVESFRDKDLSKILSQSAQYVMRRTSPLILAWYKYNNDEKEDAFGLAQYSLYHTPHKNSCYAHTLMGVILADQVKDKSNAEEYEAAFGEYRTAISQCPLYAPVYVSWGYSLEKQGKPKEAIEKYKRAMSIDPKLGLTYVRWGLILLHGNIKEREEARELFKKAAIEDPLYPWAYVQWGLYYRYIGDDETDETVKKRDYDEAVKKYQTALAVDPEFSIAYFYWANLLEKENIWNEAIEKYRKATELNPEFSDAYFKWGNILFSERKYEEAKEKFTKTIELDPQGLYAHSSMGAILFEQEKYEEASTHFEQEARLDENHGDKQMASIAYNNWGDALYKMNRKDEARAKYEKAKELDPEGSGGKEAQDSLQKRFRRRYTNNIR